MTITLVEALIRRKSKEYWRCNSFLPHKALGSAADIDEVTLTGVGGEQPLANGYFCNDMHGWFFSSGRSQMPWHAKNIPVNVPFDQDYVGLALFLLLTASSLWRLNIGEAHQRDLAPYLSSAMIGFLVVGIFDSLIHVPKLTLMFYLLVLVLIGFMLGAFVSRGRPAEPNHHRQR